MKDIAFVLWVVLWPIACSLDDYLVAKRKFLTGEPFSTVKERGVIALINIIIWIAIGCSIR